jgi:hypothetical protein
MQYALVDDLRSEAFPKGRGTCPICGSDVIAKCGSQIVHHWAHAHLQDCDPWWENETLWHRAWKNLFPPECREVSHVATDGEIHRADIKTPTGIVIEVQHSSMTDAERISREEFYGNLVWIVDGSGFRNNFDIFHMLPDPNSELAKGLVWSKGSRKMRGAARGQFWRLSEESHGSTKVKIVRCHSIREIEDDIKLAYRGHHQYGWIKPRKIWLNSNCPVYIDFGDENLLRLEIYDDTNLPCICYVSKTQICARCYARDFC